jgi:hypothetical protein
VQLCYVDESGTAETLVNSDPNQQPAIVIAGISLPEQDLTEITHEWIKLKARFHPNIAKSGHGWLDAILREVKGAKLRNGFRASSSQRQRKQAIGMIDGTIRLLERYDAKLIGRIWVKQLGVKNDDMKVHASSLQFICGAFDAGLPAGERGMVVVDSQTYQHNHRLAHSVFTQRFAKEPKHCGLVDMPVFGHSDNHAGLQIADLLCSALLAPIACAVYAGSYGDWNRHYGSSYLDIRELFGSRLGALTYQWTNPRGGNQRSSLIVSDPLSKRGAPLMWGPRSEPRRRRAASAKPQRRRSRVRVRR